jgi:hypothetical protein
MCCLVQVRAPGATDEEMYHILGVCVEELEHRNASIADVQLLCKAMTTELRECFAHSVAALKVQ